MNMKKSNGWVIAKCMVVAFCGTGATADSLAAYIETGIPAEGPRPALVARAQSFNEEYEPQERTIYRASRNIDDVAPTAAQKISDSRIKEFVAQAVKSGQMEASVALQLLRSLSLPDFANLSGQAQKKESSINIENSIFATNEVKAQPMSMTAWEILDTDGTLQNTLARWGEAAKWQVHWSNMPEIKNPGYIKLPDRDFISAAEYVLSKAKVAAKSVGIDVSIKAYTNRVLVISKEDQK